MPIYAQVTLTEHTSWLFGDNLQEEVRKIGDANKVANTVRGDRQYSIRGRARGRFPTRGSGYMYGSRGTRPPQSQSRGNGRYHRGCRNLARSSNAMNKPSTSQGEVSLPCFTNNHDICVCKVLTLLRQEN